jgi:hypothetical protein
MDDAATMMARASSYRTVALRIETPARRAVELSEATRMRQANSKPTPMARRLLRSAARTMRPQATKVRSRTTC